MTPRAWSMTLVLACVVAARADEPPGVRYRDDRLTVRLTATPRNEVLIDVAQATGAAVRGRLEDADTPVTASFDALPLDEALRRLPPKQAFALKYDGDRVAAIEPSTPREPSCRRRHVAWSGRRARLRRRRAFARRSARSRSRARTA
jgi:hypothetical protein